MAPQINGSVVKAFEILHLFSPERPVITAADLARDLDLNAVTAHRFLRTLEQVGAVVAESRGHYRLSFVFADLGDRVRDGQMIARLAQPHLNQLTDTLGEGAMATGFNGVKVVCIARAVPRRALAVEVRVGSELEAWCTAHGKLWLAHLPPADLDRYCAAIQRQRFTAATLTDETRLRAELAAIRERGHAVNRGEREEGLFAMAVPVRSRTGRMVTGLSLFGPSSRLGGAQEMILEALRRAARRLEAELYGDPVPATAASAERTALRRSAAAGSAEDVTA
ncbi:helix-turn-helix domain-containing protein [Microvirga tunisiensis]|uniref:Helix-turn-helix domain-containing protein n=1 Tax=Pannonibacter tanglangensis TaxID=2750084 RepID=A0A7X5J8R7_9HYPH|nr:IclR family transcriptional regulator [Pannonibacter sp. XCT-53]NBN77535.1 helix-turn-helix domain-containing protein [Pannonibacter sp. XCT-53]